MEIALKLGTCYTSIFLAGSGVVLREPSLIAFNGDTKEGRVKAVGREARLMQGKSVDKITIVSPVKDGIIVDEHSCALMLERFIQKLYPASFIFRPRIRAIVGLPLGLKAAERETYESVCYAAYVNSVTLVPNILMCGIGIDLPVGSEHGGIIVNIGGGVTEIAVFTLSEIISGYSVSIGGNMLDRALTDSIAGKFNLKIGLVSARQLREEAGSLLNGDKVNMVAAGMDIRLKAPGKITVTSADVLEVVKPYYLRITDAVNNVIKACPPEVAGDILQKGIFVTGGASKIPGLTELFEERSKLEVNTVKYPELAAVVGGGKLLSNKELLREIS